MTRRLDFSDHRRELGLNRYIYAVVSRRAQGLSIGVNLNPDKVCNFDCPYCQVDRTVPGGDGKVDLERLETELVHLLDLLASGHLWDTPPFDTAAPDVRRVADIAFAGDGEPTSPAKFAASTEIIRRLRDERAPGVPIRLLTNSTLLHRPNVRKALPAIDEIWCKLDAGTPEYFAEVDGTTFPFERILKNLRDLARERAIVIQSMFLTISGKPASDHEILAWVGLLRELARHGTISSVQVYTVARAPADKKIGILPTERLRWIAAQAQAAGLPALVI